MIALKQTDYRKARAKRDGVSVEEAARRILEEEAWRKARAMFLESHKLGHPDARGRFFNAVTAEAQTCRSMSSQASQTVPESARRELVVAEASLDAKKYSDAHAAYMRALRLVPWYPRLHFNLALVMDHLDSRGEAIARMTCFLELDPNASDAREAKDQLYKWEAPIMK